MYSDRPKVGTLGDDGRKGNTVTVYCPEGHSRSWLIDELAAKFGADYPLQRFYERCRCSTCGKRPSHLTLHPNVPGTGYPRA